MYSTSYRLKYPWCKMCLDNEIYEPAIMVDHVHPINQGGDLFPSDEGLQGLCKSCEGKKNRMDRGPT